MTAEPQTKPWRHGTIYCHHIHRCRCQPCVVKWNDYCRRYRQARRAAKICVECGAQLRGPQARCRQCSRKNAIRTRRWHHRQQQLHKAKLQER